MKLIVPIQHRKKLSTQQLHFICQQLSFALAGGMPLPVALFFVGSEMHDKRCQTFLLQLAEQVQQGTLLTAALRQTDWQYSPVLLEFTLAGEQNGTMQTALEQAAEYFRQQQKTKEILVSALSYPALIMVLMAFAFGAMFLLVVPAIVQTYDNMQAPLPMLTRCIIAVSGWLQQFWFLLLGGVALLITALVLALRRSLQSPAGRARLRGFLLRLPFVGACYQQYWFIQFSQALGLMLSSGMLLVECLQAVTAIYRRGLFADEMQRLTAELMGGQPFNIAVQRCSLFPPMARQVLAVSEQTGALPQAMVQMSRYYQQQFQQRLQMLGRLLEPCFILVLGIAVLVLAGSLFLPLIQSYQYLL